jgi:hypothetical protein
MSPCLEVFRFNKKLYGNCRVTYDLRAGVYSDASGLFSSRYGIVP